MIPSSRWFPTTLQERAAWYTNFNTNIQVVGASVGLTVAELLVIAHDWETFEYLANATVTLDTYVEAVRNYRRIITEGDVGDPTPEFPANLAFSLPFEIDTGLFERLDRFVKRIRVAPAYTDEMGALLGILTSSGGGPSPEGATVPVLKPEALPGNQVSVKFTRGNTNGIAIEMQIDIETAWSNAGSFGTSPAILNIAPGEDNLPRAVRLRARYLDGNDPVGMNSDTVNVVTTP